MELATLLAQNREAVLEKWFDAVVRTYPKQAADILARQKDRFRNPIRHAIVNSIGPIYDQIASDMDAGELRAALDGIVRLRSIQEFAPSTALAFVFQLKTVVREVLGDQARELERSGGLADLDARIDRVALLAFDKYTECREQVFEIRTREIRSLSHRLLERINVKPGASQNKGESVDEVI